ncbi:hypothetical protein [Isoalcanivorax beigongshangi]|uniref:DUF4148 domain-containing protein n=1 Tax=Isoalcanivorax beigongshangi TaxID=3238810 RepID=A0ABV4AKC2_9GAMM
MNTPQWLRMISVMGMAALASGQANAKIAEAELTREERATRDAYSRIYSGEARLHAADQDTLVRQAVAERQQQEAEQLQRRQQQD